MRKLLVLGSLLFFGLLLLGCPPSESQPAPDAEEAQETPAEDPSLDLQFLFDGGLQALLPCEPREPEASKNSDGTNVRAATCQGLRVHVTALWMNSANPEEFDLEEDGDSIMRSARAALERREATDIESDSQELEVDGRPALHTELTGTVDEQPLRVEAVIVSGDRGGWGLQLLYNADDEPSQTQAERILDSIHIEREGGEG